MTEKTRISYYDTPESLFGALRAKVSGARFFSVADKNTAQLYTKFFDSSPDGITPAGEESKTLSVLSSLWSQMISKGLTRRDCLVAFGGGAITDLGGFAASTYKRGMRLIYIPTSLIGMIDAASGGKTAIDYGDVKNSIGSFYLPDEVLVCTKFLETLPREEIDSGKGELLKYALLLDKDPETFLSEGNIAETVKNCLEYKEKIVAQDLRDTGERQALNLGHTAGHALEALHLSEDGYSPIPHGIAVAAGLVIEAFFSFALGKLPQETLMNLARFTKDHFPPVLYRCGDYDRLWGYALQDKKNTTHDGGVNTVLIERPGRVIHGISVDRKLWDEGFDFYKDFFRI